MPSADDVLVARAALIALRSTLPESQRPTTAFVTFLPDFDALQEDNAADRLAALPKPQLCFASLAMDALVVATWSGTDVTPDSDVHWIYRRESPDLICSIRLSCAGPPGVTSELVLPLRLGQQLFQEYVFLSSSGLSVSEPVPDKSMPPGLVQDVTFYPHRPGPVGWIVTDNDEL